MLQLIWQINHSIFLLFLFYSDNKLFFYKMIQENIFYRIYTIDKTGKKYYINASEGQINDSKLILKSFKTADNINSLFKFKRSGKKIEKTDPTNSETFLINTVENLFWTIGIKRGTSTTSYSKQKYMNFPDLTKYIPVPKIVDENPTNEEEEEEEEEIDEEMETLLSVLKTNASMTQHFVQAIGSLYGGQSYKTFTTVEKLLSFETSIKKGIKDLINTGIVKYDNNEGGPNLYITKKIDMVPNESQFYNFYIQQQGNSLKLFCYNYESGYINAINAEDIGEFSNIIINRYNTIRTPFYIEEASIPVLPKNVIAPGKYYIKNDNNLFLSYTDKVNSELTFDTKEKGIFEISYYYNTMVIKTESGLFLSYTKWKDTLSKEDCFKHIKDTEVGWDRWIINTFHPFDPKYERKNYYPSDKDDDYVWCNSNKNIRSDLIKYSTPKIKLSDTFSDSILGKNCTFNITNENFKCKLTPVYWKDYALRTNPYGNELLIRLCDIEYFEFIPITISHFKNISNNKMDYIFIFLIPLFIISMYFLLKGEGVFPKTSTIETDPLIFTNIFSSDSF